MNQQLLTDISDVFIRDPLRNFLTHPATIPTAVVMLVYLIWEQLRVQGGANFELGEPAWNAFFKARGFAPKHQIVSDGESNSVVNQWGATVDGVEWLISDRASTALFSRSLTMWLSAEVPVESELKAVSFHHADLVAWATRRCRSVALSPRQARKSRPSYSFEAARLSPLLAKVAPLEWPHGHVQVLLEKRRLTVVFEIGRYAIDDATLLTAARDFARILGPFGAARSIEVPYTPDSVPATPRLEQSSGTAALIASLVGPLVVYRLVDPYLMGPAAMPLRIGLLIATYLLIRRIMR